MEQETSEYSRSNSARSVITDSDHETIKPDGMIDARHPGLCLLISPYPHGAV